MRTAIDDLTSNPYYLSYSRDDHVRNLLHGSDCRARFSDPADCHANDYPITDTNDDSDRNRFSNTAPNQLTDTSRPC